MTYKINQIFQSLQGEGYHSGMPAIFIRFSGCNLHCPFCDTNHTTGKHQTLQQILQAISAYNANLVVLTGGEPSLFVDDRLIEALHKSGKTIAIETNGTHPLPHGIDWVTLSPKSDFCEAADPILKSCDELKIVYTGKFLNTFPQINAKHRFVQPCDTGNKEHNAQLALQAAQWCIEHPQWRLSLQIHKIIGIE